MITFEQFTERVYKGLKADLTKGKKKVTNQELKDLAFTRNANGELEGLDTSDVTDMKELFDRLDYGEWSISDIDDWDTSNVTDMSWMFAKSKRLRQMPKFKDMSKVTSTAFMFSDCTLLEETADYNTESLQDASVMFGGCRSLKKPPKLNTTKVADMSLMFGSCGNLEEAPTNYDTANVTDMEAMFSKCKKLKKGDLSNWDISKVVNHNEMFLECDKFPEDKKPKFKD